ncbi:MAG TPA: hypothetical protein VK525_22185 [Candidatus Saccharimonadales bacterium]|nr:hypothetical protein [Candidatus Saccharimonadales bacterium]
MLVLITNDVPPYWTEVVNVMAQPRGSRYWFRYLKKHTPEGDIETQEINQGLTSSRGMSGIILLRNSLDGLLYPIRAFTRAKSEGLGDLTLIDFCVGNFPTKAGGALQAGEFSGGFKKVILASALTELVDGKNVACDLKPLVLRVEEGSESAKRLTKLTGEELDSQAHDEDRWVKTIESIQNFQFCKTSCFLYLRRLQNEAGKALPYAAKRGYLRATAGTELVAKVTEFCPSTTTLVKPPPASDALEKVRRIELCGDASYIRIVEGQHTLDGRYDGCELTFKTETGSAGANTVLRISPSKSARTPEFVPTITADLEIHHAPWQRAVLLIGVLLLFIGCYENVTITNETPSVILKQTKQIQIFNLMIAAGVVLTTWLGQDFWATFFRRKLWLWSTVSVFDFGRQAVFGMLLVFMGSQLVGWWSLFGLVRNAVESVLSQIPPRHLIGDALLAVGGILLLKELYAAVFKKDRRKEWVTSFRKFGDWFAEKWIN